MIKLNVLTFISFYARFYETIKSKKGGTVKIYRGLFVFVLCFLLPYMLAAETIAVLDFKPIGVDYALVDAVVTLLRSDIASYKKYTLIEKDKVEKIIGGATDCADKDCAAAIGEQVNAEKVVYGTISKLGEKYIIAASVVEVATKKLVFQDRISAASAEDLDVVSKRLAKSIVTGKAIEKTAEIGAVTEEEEKVPRRRTTFFTTGGKFGWGMPLGDSYGGANSLMIFDALFWYETPKFMVEVQFELITTPATSISQQTDTTIRAMEFSLPDLSLYYLFTKTDFCPYVGGGLGFKQLFVYREVPGQFQPDAETASGMGLNVGGGIIAFRTYDFRLLLGARYGINFASPPVFEGPHHSIQINFGITYRGGGCGGGFGGLGGGFGGGCL